MDNSALVNTTNIENRIFTIRGFQIMLDSHLAELYLVETGALNRAVKRNIDRFPVSFMFRLTPEEWDNLRYQIGTSSDGYGGRRYLPYVFTEQGIAMLSAVLSSQTAIKVSIQIMQAFAEMRKFIIDNGQLFKRLVKIESKQLDADDKFERIFNALDQNQGLPKQGIFFDGQVFDAFNFIADLIRAAEQSIILIDNYIDDSILQLFTKAKKGVTISIYTRQINKALQLDISKFNQQYGPVKVFELSTTHDRFLIIDKKHLYHIGASLKDLGKKWFAFSKMDTETINILSKLQEVGNE